MKLQPLGPYSHVASAGNFIFCSGQIALDPMSKEIIKGGITEQTRQVIRNIESILRDVDSHLDHIIKTEVFLTDMDDFKEMNGVYAEMFVGTIKPARSTVEVSRLPKDALIEIACIAYKKV